MADMSVADHNKVVDTVSETNIADVVTTTVLDVADADIADDVTTITISNTSLVMDVKGGNSNGISVHFDFQEVHTYGVSVHVSPSKLPRRLNLTSACPGALKPRLIKVRGAGATNATKGNAGESKREGTTTEEAVAGATSFTLFPNLPSELRLKVWRFACAPPQELHITVARDRLSSTTDYGNGDGVYDIGMYYANRESRFEALLFNGPVFILPTGDFIRLMLDTVYFNMSQPSDCPLWPGGSRRSRPFQLLCKNLSLTVKRRALPPNFLNSNLTSYATSQFIYKNLVLAPAETRTQAEFMVEALDEIFTDRKHLKQIKEQWLHNLWECQKDHARKMMFLAKAKMEDDGEFKKAMNAAMNAAMDAAMDAVDATMDAANEAT